MECTRRGVTFVRIFYRVSGCTSPQGSYVNFSKHLTLRSVLQPAIAVTLFGAVRVWRADVRVFNRGPLFSQTIPSDPEYLGRLNLVAGSMRHDLRQQASFETCQ